MAERATPAQDKLAAYIVSDLRGKLSVERIRALGVPRQVHSDYELIAAMNRDGATESPGDRDMAEYDRRVLLNVIAWLAGRPTDPDPDDVGEDATDG